MGIELDKILNIDIEVYVKSQGRKLQDYSLKGVQYLSSHNETKIKTFEHFANKVPPESEVVVNYQEFPHHDTTSNQIGVALILKEEITPQ